MKPLDCSLAQLEIVRRQVENADAEACERLVDELQKAKRIFVGGAGRSLLSMKMFAMRLMQTNHVTYLVGEVCTPSIGEGDLLVVSSGRGETRVTLEVVKKAQANQARAALITSNPGGSIARIADVVLTIPPAAPVSDGDSPETIFVKQNQPGNLFETASLLVADGLVTRIMEREGLTEAVVMKNHANLE
ncbi:MAG: SIS domain-containing protein [Planctomycetes bacterium]|nr:SIS domain-containing protein [Planctomycetota bacterium]